MLVAMPTLYESIYAIAMVAAVAPVISALLPKPGIPQVVFLILGGMLIGPEVLDRADPDAVEAVSQLGLGFLFLLAGYELELTLFRRSPGRLALKAWSVSALLAGAAVFAFGSLADIDGGIEVTIALTTTALGTLLPILRDNGTMKGPMGEFIFAAGAVGEFMPVLAMALLLSSKGAIGGVLSLVGMGISVFIVVKILSRLRKSRVVARLGLQDEGTGQIMVRWTILLLAALLLTASDEGLDVVLGGFLAGVVLRRWGPRNSERLEGKLDVIGWGLLIPAFFVTSGMNLDIRSILQEPWKPVVFAGLMFLIRGLPALVLYRGVLTRPQRWQMALYTATALPLLVALSEVGQDAGVMSASDAATLVGAGVISVMVFPQVATLIGERVARRVVEPDAVSGKT
jgi:Kef-type K+ transport system membrane component KefB